MRCVWTTGAVRVVWDLGTRTACVRVWAAGGHEAARRFPRRDEAEVWVAG